MRRQRSGRFAEFATELVAGNSPALQKRIERIEALKTATQNFIIRQSFFCPTLEDAINADAFQALKLVVLQIGIVNHLADLLSRFVSNCESLPERFESAILVDMRKFGVEHVERHRVGLSRSATAKRELRRRIDELADEPR